MPTVVLAGCLIVHDHLLQRRNLTVDVQLEIDLVDPSRFRFEI